MEGELSDFQKKQLSISLFILNAAEKNLEAHPDDEKMAKEVAELKFMAKEAMEEYNEEQLDSILEVYDAVINLDKKYKEAESSNIPANYTPQELSLMDDEFKLTETDLKYLVVSMLTIDALEQQPEIFNKKPKIKEQLNDLKTALKNGMEILSEEQKKQVIEAYNVELENIAKREKEKED